MRPIHLVILAFILVGVVGGAIYLAEAPGPQPRQVEKVLPNDQLFPAR